MLIPRTMATAFLVISTIILMAIMIGARALAMIFEEQPEVCSSRALPTVADNSDVFVPELEEVQETSPVRKSKIEELAYSM